MTEQQNDDTHPLELDYPDGETLPEESPLDGDQDDAEDPRLETTIHPRNPNDDPGHRALCGERRTAPGRQVQEGVRVTGVCASCSGRFDLHEDGSLTLHAAAAIEERKGPIRRPAAACRDPGRSGYATTFALLAQSGALPW